MFFRSSGNKSIDEFNRIPVYINLFIKYNFLYVRVTPADPLFKAPTLNLEATTKKKKQGPAGSLLEALS